MIHADYHRPMHRAAALIAVLVLGLLLAWLLPPPPGVQGIAGYGPLHTLLETFAVVVASLVFAVGWNAHSRELPRNIVLLACAFLGVALLDFSHALSFAGMPDYVTPSDPEKAIGFWLAARLLAALALLAAVVAPWRPLVHAGTRYALLAAALAAAAGVHWLLLLHPAIVPRTFVAGVGLTPLKVGAEYVLIALYGAAAAGLWLRMRRPQPFNAAALFVSVCTMALSECFFTFYANVNDAYNLLGHVYKVIAYLFLYRALFVETVERPYVRLHLAQAQLLAAFRTIPDLLWLKDTEGRYIDCNAAVERMAGRARPAIVGHRDDDFMGAERAEQIREHDRRVMAAGQLSVHEEWLPNGAGRGLFEVIKSPVRDLDGRLMGVLGMARDVTAARESQEALRVSEQRQRQAARVANIGIFDHDHVVGTIYWSAEQRAIYGLPGDEPVTLAAYLACVHPDDRERVAAAVTRAHDPAGDGVFDIEHRIVRRDGTERHVATRAQTLFEGAGAQRHMLRTVGAVLDITERKAAEQALRLRDNALRTSFNAIAMADTAGRITYVNEAFLQLWQLGREAEALGRPTESFWQDSLRARGVVSTLLGGAGSWRGELVGLRGDGSTFDVAVWASLATDGSGRPIGLMASFLDITERKNAQAQLQLLNATLEARVQERSRELALRNDELVRAEKMAALGSLVAGVAHELNTPIGNAVMVASTLSGRQREFEAGIGEGVRRAALEDFLRTTRDVGEVLERNLQRAAELIGSFKQVAVDQSSYQRRRFELSEVVQEIALALSPTLRRSGVALVDQTPPGLRMDSFPGPLGQVFINLVNNAVDHAFEGVDGGSVQIGAVALGDGRVRITVADDGRGIAPEHLKQIFDPFFTTRLGQGGSGLGLHIAYTLVNGLLGGRIDVRSAPGEGTLFTIELPCVAPAASVPNAAAG